MKKSLSACFALVLVISLLLTATGTVVAAPLNGGPTISPSSGGGTAALTTIPVSKLPGTEANAAGTLFPIGHTSGDLMFSGSGVQVSGLVGSATLSMPMANFAKGWNGSIYQWLNEDWVKIPTTVSQKEESADGTAAATIYSDGIYALIVSYKLPDEPVSKCPKGTNVIPVYDDLDGSIALLGLMIFGYPDENWLQVGDSVTYRITNVSAGSLLEGPLTGAGDVAFTGGIGIGTYLSIVIMEGDYRFTYEMDPTFTLTVNIKGCHLRADFPEDWIMGAG